MRVFSTFLESNHEMSGVFYHSAIHGFGFFICFLLIIDSTRREKKRQSTQIGKLTQFTCNTTKVIQASSSMLTAASQRTPSQISSNKMSFTTLAKMSTRGNVAKNNKTWFFCVYNMTGFWLISARTGSPIYLIIECYQFRPMRVRPHKFILNLLFRVRQSPSLD